MSQVSVLAKEGELAVAEAEQLPFLVVDQGGVRPPALPPKVHLEVVEADVIAEEIAADLKAALEQFEAIATDLRSREEAKPYNVVACTREDINVQRNAGITTSRGKKWEWRHSAGCHAPGADGGRCPRAHRRGHPPRSRALAGGRGRGSC